ncbi:ABC transporter permease [Pseudoclavibacter sp. CFCC 13796]|uniref:ABC transporter permease n=1 Tax=Pseudoclavibacter sp. CFCC 13796 TaxID=2615179 RepID=UPI001300D138|nr:ABC transporter permease [Pseudoclavibacter sp. CFCC 13796]KAB1660782.1 ABC transporter permease [Pseudoclavibacter sp. CFCC 13796]
MSVTTVAALPQQVSRFRLPLPAFLRRHNISLWVGCVIVGGIVLAGIAAPLLTPHDPTAQSLMDAWAPAGNGHLLGTDQLGRDIWARLLYGARTNLAIAAIAVVVPFLLGTLLGAIAGYFGGWIDAAIMRIADVVVAFPFYVLIIALVFVLGNGPTSIFVAISLVSWVAYCRIVRAETVILKDRDFIAACKASGLSHKRILIRHVLPNTATQAIVYGMSDIVMNIGVIVTLSYFGLGIVPPTPDWGQMMNDGQQFIIAGQYSLILYPSIAVVLTSFGLALLGDGLARTLKVRR